MIFKRSDLIKTGVTAIATAIITVLVMVNNSGSLHFLNPHYSLFVKGSRRIPWDTAQTMEVNFAKFKNPMYTKYKTKTGKDTTARLQGFVLKAKQLDMLINNNPVGKPDSIVLYFGLNGNPKKPKKAEMHIIAIGSKSGTLLINPIYPNDTTKTIVYDKADPCPPNCPNVPKLD